MQIVVQSADAPDIEPLGVQLPVMMLPVLEPLPLPDAVLVVEPLDAVVVVVDVVVPVPVVEDVLPPAPVVLVESSQPAANAIVAPANTIPQVFVMRAKCARARDPVNFSTDADASPQRRRA